MLQLIVSGANGWQMYCALFYLQHSAGLQICTIWGVVFRWRKLSRISGFCGDSHLWEV